MEQREQVKNTKKGLRARLKSRLNRRRVLFLCALLTIVVASSAAWWFYNYNFGFNNNDVQVSEYRKEYLELKKNKPASEQPTEKAAYYHLLADKAAKSGDYNGAINAFEERKKILGRKMPAVEHLELAVFYCRMDDTTGAIDAIEEGLRTQGISANDKVRLEESRKSINEQGCDVWVSPLDQE